MFEKTQALDLAKYIYKKIHRSPALLPSHENTARYRNKVNRTAKATNIFDIFQRLIAENDWDDSIAEAKTQNNWVDLVGNLLASNTQLIEITNDKTAKIKVNSSTWATQVKIMKNDIIRNINKNADKVLVEDIVIVNTERKQGGQFVRNRNRKPF